MQLPAQQFSQIVAALRREDKTASRSSEKRRAPRIPVGATVNILDHATGRQFTALTRDLSVGGLGLMQTVALAKEQHITVTLPRSRGGNFTIQCRVTHAAELADGVWAIGAQFLSFVIVAPTLPTPLQDEALRIQKRMLS